MPQHASSLLCSWQLRHFSAIKLNTRDVYLPLDLHWSLILREAGKTVQRSSYGLEIVELHVPNGLSSLLTRQPTLPDSQNKTLSRSFHVLIKDRSQGLSQ